jgi:succinate-semialdehyde dehydrogenase/glutarate-semialdehyde dehydrogenase
MDTKTETQISLNDPSLLHEQCYIDGEWVDAADGKSIDVNNPATGEIIGTVPSLSADETRRAIDAADAAWPAWRSKTGKERCNIMRRWYDLMMENQEDLAVLMTSEQGKPMLESRGEIAYAASFIEWFAEEAKRVYGDTMNHPLPGKRIVVIKQPIGVVAAITPWNFPAAMITRKCAPAMAAGCPVVIKPASQTPLSALALAELAERAGIPKGVLNVITGQARVLGGELTENPTVRKLSFTGSTEIGKLLMSQCAGTVKKVSHREEGVPRARRQRAVHRLRRCGSGCRCGGRHAVEVSQRRTDLRMRQPFPRPGRRLRCLRRTHAMASTTACSRDR